MKKKHIVYLGLSGFPFGLAAIQRQKLISQSLVENGWDVTIVCSKSVHKDDLAIKKVGRFQGVKYVYIYSPYRDTNFIIRNVKRIISPIIGFYVLYKLNKRNKIKFAIISNANSFNSAIYSWLYSKALRFKTIINLVEIYKDRPNTPLLSKINNYLFNSFGLYFYKAFLPISKNLALNFGKFNKAHLYLPVIVDMDKLNIQDCHEKLGDFFLFCGAAGYPHSIEFIIKTFELINDKNCNLVLVSNGSDGELNIVNSLINRSKKKEKIHLLKNLSENELYCRFKSAKALLCPLFNTVQDNARFPHKLGEYLASGSVVITNDVGELKFYLKDKETALISQPGDVAAFANDMDWILSNQNQAKEIGNNGKKISEINFNSKVLGKSLSDFLEKL